MRQCIIIFFAVSLIYFFSPYKALAESGLVKRDYLQTNSISSGNMVQRNVIFRTNDYYWMRTLRFTKSSVVPYIMNFKIPGRQLTVQYVQTINKQQVWRTLTEPKTLPAATCFLKTDKLNMILSQANVYKLGLHNTIEVKDKEMIPLKINKLKNGYILTVSFRQLKGMTGEFWALQSPSPMIDWSNPVMGEIWSGYDLNGERKWTSTGFFIKTPYNYRPRGPSVFWKCPSNFVANSFVQTGGSSAADELGWVMLNTALKSQNTQGYWESGPLCEWLWNDYKIGYDYFDTRFNTDMALSLLKGYKRYDDLEFFAAAEKYAKWLINHAKAHHYNVADDFREGWLVEDYWCPSSHSKTHVSLNHQLQEISFLYEMHLVTQDNSYLDIANKMLTAIKITSSRWVKPNGDLYYCYLTNGQMSKNDYPYLTYNDLFYTQNLIRLITNQSDPDLQFLMDKKRSWMDQNNIYNYRRI